MKRTFYLALMILLFVILYEIVYLAILVILVRYRMIWLDRIIPTTDILMSREAYGLVMILATISGYLFWKRWWQIIYVEGVYYFGKEKMKGQKKSSDNKN